LNLCTSQQLSFVRQYVDPLLKKDPFTCLPNEICLRVCISRRPCNLPADVN
jgi:F-box and WD-40 domain protein CDC4